MNNKFIYTPGPTRVRENVRLYPKAEYSVSETVQTIAQEIESATGYTREDYHETE